MPLLLLCLLYFHISNTGIELAFFSVVYGTAIGNTNNLVDSGESPKKYIGLSGMLIGVGEILGGLSFGILGSKTNRLGRDSIVILGYFTHMVAFFLVFINFPKNASLQQSNEAAYIASRYTAVSNTLERYLNSLPFSHPFSQSCHCSGVQLPFRLCRLVLQHADVLHHWHRLRGQQCQCLCALQVLPGNFAVAI